MADITFLHDCCDDETPFWSHDLDDLPPSDHNLDLDLGLDLDLDFSTNNLVPDDDDDDDVDDYGFMSADCGIDDSEWRQEIAFSDSDDEIEGIEADLNPGFEDENDDRDSVQICWDSLRLEEEREVGGEGFEWEEVDGRVDERDVLSAFFDDDVDVSVSMEEEETMGTNQVSNLEWEILLNIYNLDDVVEEEYEMLVGTEIRKPPASKKAIEGLKVVVVTDDDVALCVVCKDDMAIGEEVKVLPCSHRYHGCCIDPWLGIRNTCPVCRYELPTDDPEYERRVERGGEA